MTRLVNEADIVNKTRPLFTLSLEMTRLVTKTRLLLVPGVNLDIYGTYFRAKFKPKISEIVAGWLFRNLVENLKMSRCESPLL